MVIFLNSFPELVKSETRFYPAGNRQTLKLDRQTQKFWKAEVLGLQNAKFESLSQINPDVPTFIFLTEEW